MQVHAETVADVLKEAGVASSESEIVEITHKLNERNIFPADRAELAYVVREPIVNRALAGCVRRCVSHIWPYFGQSPLYCMTI